MRREILGENAILSSCFTVYNYAGEYRKTGKQKTRARSASVLKLAYGLLLNTAGWLPSALSIVRLH